MAESLSAGEVFELGQKYLATATLVNDLIVKEGRGSWLLGRRAARDKQDRWFLDFACSITCNTLGYGLGWGLFKKAGVAKAIDKQLTQSVGIYSGNDWYNEKAVLLAKKLCEITPGQFPKKVFLCNSGTEAVEAAIKYCQARRLRQDEGGQRSSFVSFEGAFHGRTLGALSLNGSKNIHTRGFFYRDLRSSSPNIRFHSRAVPVYQIPFPHKYSEEEKKLFISGLDNVPWFQVNACFLELVQGEGGIRVIDEECLQRLVKICRDNDVYLVADEVQTGFKRTAKMFACEHYNFEPSITCLAKSLSGGAVPIGATVFNACFDPLPGQHSNTFGGSPLACAVALAFIEELEELDDDELVLKAEKLAEVAPQGLGLMRRVPFKNENEASLFKEKVLDKGLIVVPAGSGRNSAVRLMPPLNISMADLELGIGILKDCLAS